MNKALPPLIVTLDELTRILQPVTMGYAWGENTITDLWKQGAPIPPNKRIVTPGNLTKWLADVLEKKGQPLDAAAKVYTDLLRQSG